MKLHAEFERQLLPESCVGLISTPSHDDAQVEDTSAVDTLAMPQACMQTPAPCYDNTKVTTDYQLALAPALNTFRQSAKYRAAHCLNCLVQARAGQSACRLRSV